MSNEDANKTPTITNIGYKKSNASSCGRELETEETNSSSTVNSHLRASIATARSA